MFSNTRFGQVCFAFLCAFVFTSTANSQTALPTILNATGESLVRLEHSTHPLTRAGTDGGRVESSKTLKRMLLTVSSSTQTQEALDKFLEELQTSGSANYHHWLSAAEFGTRFSASHSDIESIRGWLESNGFTVDSVANSGRWIEFSGTSSQVEIAFHTELHYFRVAGKQYLANSTDISLPQSIARISKGLVSLNNFPKRPPTQLFHGIAGMNEQGQKVTLSPNLTAAGNTNTYYVAPGDFASIYNTKPLLAGGTDGTGITIAVTGQSQIELTDVQQFRSIFGLKVNDPDVIVIGADPGITTPRDQQEATLDVEWAGAIAPGATIDLVIAGSTDSTNGVDLAAAYAVDNQLAPILTYTYGSCEQILNNSGNAFYNSLWQQAAAEGITVLVATGDNGSAACDIPGSAGGSGKAVNGAASTPYNVAVGGTQFADTGAESTFWSTANSTNYSSALGYIPEAAWNESCDSSQTAGPTNCFFFPGGNFSTLAGGGGVSTIYAKPGWQSGTGVPADGFRDIPDVSLAAASGHDDLVYCNSLGGTPCEINSQNQVVGLSLVGGTSASTPAMAGILALVEQKNGAFQGQINYTLYKLAQNSGARCDSSSQLNPTVQNACIFYDVTAGNNAVPCAGGTPDCSSTQNGVNGFLDGQATGVGYDLATGLGSVNAANLANNWHSVTFLASQTQLQLPTTSFAHGSAVSVSGNVAAISGTGTPTGSVVLKTSSSQIADVLSITAGAFSNSSVNDLPGGEYSLIAHYGGDATFSASDSNAISLTVTPENSTTSLTASGLLGSTTLYGSPVQFLAKVQGDSGVGNATGTITLEDGATTIGTYPLAADGTAFIATGSGTAYSFAVGSHSLTARYSGDNSFNSSASSGVAFNIGKSKPTVIVGVNDNSVTTTQPIGAHVNVVGFGAAIATGTVQFSVDGHAYGTPVTLQSGGLFNTSAQAATLITGLAAGSHTIAASYSALNDTSYASVGISDPNEFAQTVTVTASSGTTTTTSLTAQTLPLTVGDTGKFTVTVSPSSATGTVTLWDAVGPRTTATTIGGGTATIQFPWTQGGNITLYAVYSGDTTYAPSSSTSVPFTVKPGTPVMTLSAPTQAAATQQASLVASVSGVPNNATLPYPTGVVEFWDSLNGGAMQLLTTQALTAGAGHVGIYGLRTKLAAGTHTVKAHYAGDNNWKPVDSPAVTITVTATGDFTIGVAPDPVSVTAGITGTATVTLTPTGGFTGDIALSCPAGSASPIAGYSCGFSSATVTIANANPATATFNLTPSTANTAMVFPTSPEIPPQQRWRVSLALAMLLLGAFAFTGNTPRMKRQVAFTAGFVLCVASVITGCGGGGSGGSGPVPSTTTLTSSNLHLPAGTTVTFSVRITASSTPGGTVQLLDNGNLYSSGTVASGVATFQTATLPAGIHVLTAQYAGDANTMPSQSAPITQIISGSVPFTVTGTAASGAHTTTFTVSLN